MTYSFEGKENFNKIEVISKPGVSAEELHNRALFYFHHAYENPSYVVKINDEKNHKFLSSSYIGGGYSSRYAEFWGDMHFNMFIEAKEGRIRVTIYDIYITRSGKKFYLNEAKANPPAYDKQWQERKKDAQKDIDSILEGLKAFMDDPYNDPNW